MKGNDPRDAVVFLSQRTADKTTPLGSGVCVADDLILTALHVVMVKTVDDKFRVLDASEIAIGGIDGQKDHSVKIREIIRYDGQDALDIVLLRTMVQLPANQRVTMDFDYKPDLSQGDTVSLVGYDGDQKTAPLENPLKKQDGVTGSYAFQSYPAKGMSGGAALKNNQLVGLIHARDTDKNSGYLLPLSDFGCKTFLTKYLSLGITASAAAGLACIAQSAYIEKQQERLVRLLEKNPVLLQRAKPIYEGKTVADIASRMKDKLCEGAQQQDDGVLGNIRAMLFKIMQEHPYTSELKIGMEELFFTALSLTIPEQEVGTQQPDTRQAHEVAVYEEQTLEPLAARIYGVSPQLAKVGKVVKGKCAYQIDFKPVTGWSAKDNADAVAKELFARFDKDKQDFHKKHLRKLNSRIRSDRRDANILHYYAANDGVKNTNPLWDSKVVTILKTDEYLSNLPIFLYGEEEAVFISDLGSILEGFMHDLNEYTAKAAT